ncbi:MAG TPA: hypothetical protein VGF82_05095 [Terracidiphilus sp.]|jgi:hypothetical protein
MLTDVALRAPLSAEVVLQQVFPLGSRAAQKMCSIHVIRQGAEPRWVIIGSPRKALPVLRSWAPWRASSRVQWSVVRGSAALNALSTLPGVVNSSAALDSGYWRERLRVFPEEWSAVIHVGSPSHTRKAIVFLIENGKRVVGAGKVPLMPESAAAILNEGAVLERLGHFDNVPKVLFRDFERGVAAQSWLEGGPVSREFTEAHLELVSSLAEPKGSVKISDCQSELARGFESTDLPYDRTLLARGLDMLAYDKPLRAFIEHRDFAPWNLKWVRKGILGLLDWEWAVSKGLPWQDISRYFYLNDVHFKENGQVWEEMGKNDLLLQYRRRFEIPNEAIAPLTMRYLLRELLMEWEGGNRWLADYAIRQIGALAAKVAPVSA